MESTVLAREREEREGHKARKERRNDLKKGNDERRQGSIQLGEFSIAHNSELLAGKA